MFVDLEKVFDRVPRVLIESSLRRKGVVECYVNAVMKIYWEVLSQVKVEGEDSKEFAVRAGIHQGSILSPLIFAVVRDVVTEEVANEGCALMYADDLVLICETKEEARQRFLAWKNELKSKGLKVNISKMKVMRCAQDGVPKEAAVDPCSVCGKLVGVNSIHCYWVHGQCSGVRGSLVIVAQGFVCKACRAGGRTAEHFYIVEHFFIVLD